MTAPSDSTVRVRIAPSPTGDPHVGTGYIALFNYAFAKKHGGSFVLRIEDTDQTRSTRESEDAILDSLKWLGLSWDEGPDVGGDFGPYRQSERLSIYQEHCAMLVERGHAFWCTCTPERLARVREEQSARKENPGYDGHCIERQAEVAEEREGGAPAVIRMKIPKGEKTVFQDRLRGDIEIDHGQVDYQVLQKSDGFPTYHLAAVVDDHLMGITHIIRGEEWISSTPKHVLLYRYFQWDMPELIHLPLLRNPDKNKSKVSKRKNPVSLEYYQEAGYLPEAMVNFLGMMAFTFEDEREIFDLVEFVSAFDVDRVSLGGPVFDLKKLLWLNGRYLREKKDEAEFLDYVKTQVFSDEYLKKIIPLVQERVEKAEDFVPYAAFFFAGEVEKHPDKMMIKDRPKKKAGKIYEKLIEEVERLRPFTRDHIKENLQAFCEKNDLKPKDLFMPVRLMVTGRKATPGLFETMEVLGRERVRTRMRAALAAFKEFTPPAN
jgi:glutamyl-tRNA synthetase